MYRAAKSEAKVVSKEILLMRIFFFLTVFIREAPIEEINSSECIRTVALTYGCRILQL